ncbi:MAG: hypothetical protein ACOCRX_10680 [Candidatus Woesearchaeota archaeon]
MDEMDYPYRLVYYIKDRSFSLSKKRYEGKIERDGQMIDHYKYDFLFDGRSQEMKDRMDRIKKRKQPIIPGKRGVIEFAAESDQDAIRGIVELIFEEPETLKII